MTTPSLLPIAMTETLMPSLTPLFLSLIQPVRKFCSLYLQIMSRVQPLHTIAAVSDFGSSRQHFSMQTSRVILFKYIRTDNSLAQNSSLGSLCPQLKAKDLIMACDSATEVWDMDLCLSANCLSLVLGDIRSLCHHVNQLCH